MFRKILRKTPLAWLQVKREKQRLAVALAGIAFADVLMFVQLGLNETLYDSAAMIQDSLQGDLFLINPISEALQSLKSFPRKRLYQSAGVEAIESITPIYMGRANWVAGAATLLPIGMTPGRTALILFLTIVMCTVSGGVAMRKLQAADPADIF